MTSATSTILEQLGRAQDDLLWFVRLTYPEFQAAQFHVRLCRALERFERAVAFRKSPRLIVNMPPRHGKTFLISERFPAWFLGRNSRRRIIAASYGKDLSLDFSRKVRGLLRDELVQTVFPGLALARGTESVEQWETSAGGVYRAASVGSGITGKGADALIIDDPVKGAKEANSEAFRRTVWDWYRSEAYLRLQPGGGVIVVQTRWREDDLTGMLLDGGEEWEVLSFPAIDEHGRALHPQRYDLDALARIRKSSGEYYWSALFQQRPIARDDQPFKAGDIRRIDTLSTSPDLRAHDLRLVLDLAYTKKAGSDFTATIFGGIDATGTRRVFWADERKLTPRERRPFVADLVRRWQPVGLKQIHVEGNEDALENVREALRHESLTIEVVPLKTAGRHKVDRIGEIDAHLGGTEFGPEAEPLLTRLLEWSPVSGTPDDLPDAFAYFCEVTEYVPGRKIKWTPKPPKDPTARKIWNAMNRRTVAVKKPTGW